MSYQVLARKWRPKRFREMAGQEHVLQAVINGLDHDRLHHAYLFTGTRGVGKTTIARIFAKCLNCETGVSSEPCGTCPSCLEINENRFIDLIEVDAASRTKVEDTRELLENVQYAPTKGRYKVYLIDEVHMLSNNSFNALLKTLEEPPPHVKFLLATTDPQKLPATVLSRCLQFNLKNLSPERIVQHLKDVLQQEMVQFDEPALWLLGRAANGSMRDALSLTDQAIAFGSGKVAEADVASMLGTIDGRFVVTILQSLAQNDAAGLLAAVEHMSEHSPDYAAAIESMLLLLHRITIAQMVPDAVDNAQGDREQVLEFAAMLPVADVQLFYQMGLHARRDLPLAPDPRSGFEMAMLRMMAFRPQSTAVANAQNIGQLSAQGGQPEVKKPNAVSPVSAALTEVSAQDNIAKPQVTSTAMAAAIPTTKPEALSEKPAGGFSAASILQAIEAEDTVSEKPNAPNPTAEAAPITQPAVESESSETNTKETVSEKKTPSFGEVSQSEAVSSRAADVFNEPQEEPVAQNKAETVNDAEQLVETELNVGAQEAVIAVEKVLLSDVNPESWPAIYGKLDLSGVAKSVISHCALERVEGDEFYFVLEQRNSGLFNEAYTTKLQESLARLTGSALQLSITLGDVEKQTPAQYMQAQQEARQAEAERRIHADPNVQMLMQRFDASIIPDSIEPILNEEKV